MADFKTHIAVSTAVGVAYGWWGMSSLGVPPSAALLAGGLVSIAGTMPDLDSDSSTPARETIAFAAAVIPMILVHRLQHFGLPVEQLVLVGAPIYLFIRFGLGEVFKRYTIHRGMFHSVPAIVIAGLITFLICDSGVHAGRLFKTAGVMLGYTTHLLLDELWSVSLAGGTPTLKKSFGTALKFASESPASNSAAYGILLLLGLLVLRDAAVSQTPPEVTRQPTRWVRKDSASPPVIPATPNAPLGDWMEVRPRQVTSRPTPERTNPAESLRNTRWPRAADTAYPNPSPQDGYPAWR